MSVRFDSLAGALRQRWLEVAWGFFVLINLVAILLWAEWATVPFHFIWVSLSILYGFRIWGLRATMFVLLVVALLTGATLLVDVLQGTQQVDELTEIPLMGAIFLVMLWHVRRATAANRKLREISDRNLELLERERRFVQDASHVLRTPLTIARGHAQLLRRTTEDPEVTRDLDVIVDELDTLRKLSDRLIALANAEQLEMPQLGPTQLRPLLENAAEKWNKSGVSITLGEMADPTISAHPQTLSLALDEVIDNARRHAPNKPVSISSRNGSDRVTIEVIDEGRGIDPDETERIFERFARADESVSGAGMGLALVRRIVERHSGTICAVARPEAGGIFLIELPIYRLSPHAGDQLEGAEIPPERFSPR